MQISGSNAFFHRPLTTSLISFSIQVARELRGHEAHALLSFSSSPCTSFRQKFITSNTLVPSHRAQNTVQRSNTKKGVVWNCNTLMRGVFCFQYDMTTGLMNNMVIPSGTQMFRQRSACQITRKFQANTNSSRTKCNLIGRTSVESKKNPATASCTFLRKSSQESPCVNIASVKHSAV